jgi:selenium metabolism protein YedF
METILLNAIGDACPIPVVKASRALDGMHEPGVLEVHVDNEIAVQNVLKLAAGRSLPALSEKCAEKDFAVRITVQFPAQMAAPAAPACAPDARGNTVVAIHSAFMGVGSEELGRTLMKGFLYALSQQSTLPRTILFYNGGASIPTEGSPSLADLRNMEAQGVEILTCGTCLNYYGLTEKLAVGSVTNMYSIVEKLSAADKILAP